MTSDGLSKIVALLPRLEPDEWTAIEARIRALRSIAGGPPPPSSSRGSGGPTAGSALLDDVLHAICDVVLRASGERVRPEALRRAPQFSSLRDKAAGLEAYLAQMPRRADRLALVTLGFDLLYRSLVDAGLPASSRTLMVQAHRLPAVIDAAFPGYARSGLVGMILHATSRRVRATRGVSACSD